MLNAKIFGDLTEIIAIDGRTFRFIEYRPNNGIRCWEGVVEGVANTLTVHANLFTPDTLKEIDVWDKLTKKAQDEIDSGLDYKKRLQLEHISKMQAGRKKKYPNIPRKFTCIECGNIQSIAPGVIVKRIEKDGISIENYVENFKCSECVPRRRGKVSKDYGDVPDHVVCSGCEKVQKYHPSMIIKTAEKKGMTVKEYVDGWFCQKCKPSPRGRKKGTKIKKKA